MKRIKEVEKRLNYVEEAGEIEVGVNIDQTLTVKDLNEGLIKLKSQIMLHVADKSDVRELEKQL